MNHHGRRSEDCTKHEEYKRLARIYASFGDISEAKNCRFWADLRAPHSLHTNGVRRQRRKRGYRAWPPRGKPREIAIRVQCV